jgi:hypothetical protein
MTRVTHIREFNDWSAAEHQKDADLQVGLAVDYSAGQ